MAEKVLFLKCNFCFYIILTLPKNTQHFYMSTPHYPFGIERITCLIKSIKVHEYEYYLGSKRATLIIESYVFN